MRNNAPRGLAAGIVLAAVVGLQADASLTFYSSRGAFDGAAPGLPIDHFASNYVFQPYPNNSAYHTRPIDSSTNDALIPTGCILPGLSITTQNPLFENQALKAEANGAGFLSIGTGTFQDVLELDFSTAVSAIGADVFGHVYAGPVFPGNVEVTVYNGSKQIGFLNPTLPSVGHGFVGVTSTTANITRITFLFNPANDNSDANTFVTDVAFGNVPAPGTWTLALASGACCAVARRRR